MDYLDDDDLPETINDLEDPFAPTDPQNPENENKENNDPTTNQKKISAKRGPTSLTETDLLGPKGLAALPKYFNTNKVYQPGKEVENLDEFLQNFENWAHNMYPKWKFDMCVEKIERLGKKMTVGTHVTKMRAGERLFEGVEAEELEKVVQGNDGGNQNQNQTTGQPVVAPTTPSTQMRNLQLTDQQKQKIEENKRKAMERRKAAELRRQEESMMMDME